MKRGMLALPALAVAVLGVFASSGGSAVADEATINVRAGDGEVGYAVNTFLPQSVYLRVGDTVTWDFPWDEPHSVTFGEITGNPDAPSNPDEAVPEYDGTGFLNSGLVFPSPEGSTFSVKFTAEGTFDYYCFIHPFMTGEVVIQGPGVGEQDNQASVDARGAAAYTSSINELKAAAGAASAKPVAISSKVGGGKKYTLTVSSLTDLKSGDVMQFFPAKFNVNVNDEVEFVSTIATPHDVIFTPPGVDISAGPPAGAPQDLLEWDPFSGGYHYSKGIKLDNTSVVASPMIGNGWPEGNAASFTFTKAGTYNYACALHASQGMVGQINVTGGAPGAPNTGAGAGNGGSSNQGLLLLAGAVAVALGASTVAFAASRRQG